MSSSKYPGYIVVNGVPEVVADDLKHVSKETKLIDVRRPDEFTGELGHIDGSTLVTLGPELTQFLEKTPKNTEIIFICRSGNRSGQATLMAQQLGFKDVFNMQGGMLKWNELGKPVKR